MVRVAQHFWHVDVVRSVVNSYAARHPSGPVYVEIGVARGATFNEVAPLCKVAHGVDVDRAALMNVDKSATTRLWHMASDQFWRDYDGRPDVVFIDGEHTYQQAKRDFQSAARRLRKDGTIILHDVCPEQKRYTGPDTCGDVYRLAQELMGEPNRWRTFLLRGFPGLLLVQPNLDAGELEPK